MDPDPSLCLIALDYYEEAKEEVSARQVLLGLGCKRFESSKFEVFRAGSAKTFSPPEKRERLGSWEAGKLGLCVLCKNLLPPEAGDVGFTGDTGMGRNAQCGLSKSVPTSLASVEDDGRGTRMGKGKGKEPVTTRDLYAALTILVQQVHYEGSLFRKILMTSGRAEGAMLRGILAQSEIGQWAGEEAAELTLVNATLWAMFCHRRNCLTSQTH
ncbi:hypothetical protein BKA62DRAFT_673235 [Auriculariales sp. MPI-PUGE-AT-0066]|nr:hypothetical protein BKA62DRAFT_673235 [Auriculariales sp. MPI-PUGE-AT-0066]